LAGFACYLGLAALTPLLVSCGGAAVSSATTYPINSNTTYYIGNSGCSDGNAGTSSSAPWCTFNNVNGRTFSPGDQILLASGSGWLQQMSPLGSGVSGNPITIGCYGSTCSSNYPVINAGSSNPGIYLVNPLPGESIVVDRDQPDINRKQRRNIELLHSARESGVGL
jgi:hypothetical protein